MKRLLFILFAVLLTVGSMFAQKSKPVKGSWSTEVQINPFDQDGETFSLDGLKVRYFFTDKDAFRIKIGFAVRNFKYTDEDTDEETSNSSYSRERSYNNEFKNKTGNFKIDLGYERHFDLGKRIDAYLGASVGLGKHFASTKVDTYSKIREINSSGYPNNNRTITVSERTYTGELKNGAVTSDNGSGSSIDDLFNRANERASFDMNAAIFAGLDFYVYKGIYIGTELGLGCQTSKSLKMEFDGKVITNTTVNDNRVNTEETKVEKETTDNFRETNFKSYIEPRLRIGITF